MIDTVNIQKILTEKSRLEGFDFATLPFGKVYSDHMFTTEYKNGEWTNFKIEPYANLSLSPSTAVLHYAQAIFEGMKAYKSPTGEVLIFRPLDNFNRLNFSARRMCMPELPEEVFMGGLTELLKVDRDWVPDQDGTSLYIRPFMFAADEFIGVKTSETYKFIIFTSPAGGYYAEPIRVKVETEYSRAFPGGTGAAKAAGNYAASLYPAQLAKEQGYHQLIWTDGIEHKYIEEAGTMNVMFLINNKLVTSPAGGTVLDGINRKSVLELAADWGYEIEERPVAVTEVIDAIKQGTLQEAFGTGTAATIAQLAVIGYDGEDYQLPDVNEESFSVKILEALNDIKMGKAEDKFGWAYKV